MPSPGAIGASPRQIPRSRVSRVLYLHAGELAQVSTQPHPGPGAAILEGEADG